MSCWVGATECVKNTTIEIKSWWKFFFFLSFFHQRDFYLLPALLWFRGSCKIFKELKFSFTQPIKQTNDETAKIRYLLLYHIACTLKNWYPCQRCSFVEISLITNFNFESGTEYLCWQHWQDETRLSQEETGLLEIEKKSLYYSP